MGLSSAYLYLQDGLIQQCGETMKETINVKTVCGYYTSAGTYGLDSVKKKWVTFFIFPPIPLVGIWLLWFLKRMYSCKKEKKNRGLEFCYKKFFFTFGWISKFLESVVFVNDHGWVIHAYTWLIKTLVTLCIFY